MSKELYNDQLLVQAIRQGGREREQALQQVFLSGQYLKIVQDVVSDGGGNLSVAEKIFEDTMVALDRQIRVLAWNESELLTWFFEHHARRFWSERLRENEDLRKKVLLLISTDRKLQREIFSRITKNRGSREDAEDCYHSGMLLLETQLREGRYRGGAIRGYFYQMCFNLWRNELKKQKNISLEEGMDQPESTFDPQQMLESKEHAALLDKIFTRLGESCRQLLRLKYFVPNQLSMDEIAHAVGLKNSQNASNALSRCRNRLWELLQEEKQDTWQ